MLLHILKLFVSGSFVLLQTVKMSAHVYRTMHLMHTTYKDCNLSNLLTPEHVPQVTSPRWSLTQEKASSLWHRVYNMFEPC